MALDPLAKTVQIEVPLGGWIRMTKGLADYFSLTAQQGWPSAPVLPRQRISGRKRSSAAGGKVAYLDMQDGSTYTIRYSGTFRRMYAYLREVAASFEEEVTAIRTQRGGSIASEFDSAVPET
jgi:hypothetical protein